LVLLAPLALLPQPVLETMFGLLVLLELETLLGSLVLA
jgi:hypothetical protein